MFYLLKKLLIFIIIIGIIAGVGFAIFLYLYGDNGTLRTKEDKNKYINIEISITDFEKRSSFPDIYALSVNFRNLPADSEQYQMTTYLWNKEKGVVKFVERRNFSMDKPEITFLVNFPVTIGKEELRKSDAIKIEIRSMNKESGSYQEVVFADTMDFVAETYLSNVKNTINFTVKDKMWELNRVVSLEQFEDLLTEAENLSEGTGIVYIGDAMDYYGFYVRKTKITMDLIFLDGTFNIVDYHTKVGPTSADNISPYIEARTRSKAVIAVNGGIIDEYGLKNGDVFLLKE